MSSRVAVLCAFAAACASDPESHVAREPPEADFSEGCRTLCCKEKGAACGGSVVCEECTSRCEGACTSARPLLYCLDSLARIRLVCAQDGSVVPETDACAEQFDSYQAATRACGRPSAAVGGR